MKKLLVMVLLAPAMLFAQSSFDGTWRLNTQNAQFVGNENFSLQDGMYRCDTCAPKVQVKADGQDQKVTGSPYFDTTNVKAVDNHTVEIVNKKDGKVSGTSKMVASDDGSNLTTEWSFTAESGQHGSGKYTSKRVGSAPPAGANKISGVWQPEKIENASENLMTVTYKATADGLSMTDQIGDSYTAKFDGKDYPYKGDPGTTHVSLKKIDANTIEETDKRDGKVISVTRITVAPDGKTMSLNVDDKLHNTSIKWTAEKQ
jgi:hypothetical protein